MVFPNPESRERGSFFRGWLQWLKSILYQDDGLSRGKGEPGTRLGLIDQLFSTIWSLDSRSMQLNVFLDFLGLVLLAHSK